MSIYEKTTTNNEGSTYQVPNPLNTGSDVDTDWMSIIIVAQVAVLIMASIIIYTFDVPIFSIFSGTKKVHEQLSEEVDRTKQLSQATTREAPLETIDHNSAKATNNTKTEDIVSKNEAIKNITENTKINTVPTDTSSITKESSKQDLHVRSSTDDIAYDLQKAWYKHDLTAIEQILSIASINQFPELLQFITTHLLQDNWLTLDRVCRMANITYNAHTEVAMHCSDALMAHGQQAKALDLFNARPPLAKNSAYYVRLAYLLLETGNYRASADIYKKLLDIDNTQSTWWLGLGYALTQMGQNSQAHEAYKLAYQHADSTADYIGYLEEVISHGSYTS